MTLAIMRAALHDICASCQILGRGSGLKGGVWIAPAFELEARQRMGGSARVRAAWRDMPPVSARQCNSANAIPFMKWNAAHG